MISIVPATARLSELAMSAPGGFAWWYLDLVDDHGDGLVFIWSYGLPFLPGVRARSGPASARPALVLSVYQGGEEAFYLFQEHPPEDVDWDPATGRGRFGRTRISLQRGRDRCRLQVELDQDVPATGPLTGRLSVEGPLRRGGDDAEAGGEHGWAPLLAAVQGRAELAGAFSLDMKGRAYLDHNAGTRPMHDLGIARWHWGRIALPGRELVWYRVRGERAGAETVRVVELDARGRMRAREAPVELSERAWSWSALPYPRRVRFQDPDGRPVEVLVRARVDDAPFYQRFLVEGVCGDERGFGVAEQVVPPRIDQPWMRPFVRMRVHAVGGPASSLLPLFSGPAQGRVGRLLRSDLGRW